VQQRALVGHGNRGDRARHAAHSVVPSSGSTAMSTLGPFLVPTSSPMKSMGASSSSPSPITTVPWIGRLLNQRRIDRA
jgi:hypothetical protein